MTTITWTNDTRRLADLVPWENNPKRMSKKQADGLRLSLQKFGYAIPVLISPVDNELYDGNTRDRIMLAMEEYGPDAILDVRVSSRPLTDDERRELVVRLKQNQAGWDFDMLPNLYEREELIEWGFEPEELGMYPDDEPEGDDPGPQIDRAEELREKWGVNAGDLWQLGDHRLVCGDCTDAAVVARVMGGERAQLCVTSPPYPGADMWDDLGKVSEVESIGLDALRVVVQEIDDGCAILWNIANTPIGTQAGVVHTTTTTTTKLASEELGLLCYGEIIWSKPVQHLTPLAFMMRPVVPNLIHEYVMIFYKGKRKQRESSSGLSAEDKAIRTGSVWELSPESATETNHKAPFPVELARRCVALWSVDGDNILEPFSGSGTTLIACERLNRRCRAVEISPAYVAVALERWHEMTGQEPVLIEP